jgi:hypothetical protein
MQEHVETDICDGGTGCFYVIVIITIHIVIMVIIINIIIEPPEWVKVPFWKTNAYMTEIQGFVKLNSLVFGRGLDRVLRKNFSVNKY